MMANQIISELIQKHGLSQQTIADYLNCSQTAVSRWSENKRNIKLKYVLPLIKLARKHGLKVKIEDFVA